MNRLIIISLLIITPVFILQQPEVVFGEMSSGKYKISGDSVSGSTVEEGVNDDLPSPANPRAKAEVAGAHVDNVDNAEGESWVDYLNRYFKQIISIVIVGVALASYLFFKRIKIVKKK